MNSGGLAFHELHGADLEPWLSELGLLRIRVFHEYPYLYDGNMASERNYLSTYVKSPDSMVVLVVDAEKRVVGASTCLPLCDEGPEFKEPFLKRGFDLNEVCYFGESILLPEFRGRGIGREFFQLRETHAKKLGAKWTGFCAVERPDDHPMRPEGYRPLDAFWSAEGYQKQPDMQAAFVWKEIGEDSESPKKLTFWLKSWTH